MRVQALSGPGRKLIHSLVLVEGKTAWAKKPSCSKSFGRCMTQLHTRKPSFSKWRWWSRVSAFLTSRRSANNIRGMSILTGQTSAQAPHKLEAKGSPGSWPAPWNWGVSMAPIGPL